MQGLNKLNHHLLLVPKLLYFTVSAAFYVFHQFRSQFISDKYNLDKDNLGLYLSIPQALSFFFNIWVGSVNDRSGKQRVIILSLLLLSAVFFQMFFFTSSFMLFWISFTWYFAFLSSTLPLLDKVMLDYVSDIPDLDSSALGRQRLWSTFGYLACNFTIEHMINTKEKGVYNYNKMQFFNVFVVAVAALAVFFFVKNIPRRASSQSGSGSTLDLLKNKEYLYFISIILLCGITRAFMTNYLGLYCAKVLKFKEQPNTIKVFWPLSILVDAAYEHKQSTSTFFGVALEILLFFKSQAITAKLGFFWPILLAQVFQLLRFASYYSLSYQNDKSFAICCLIELLKGANYALIHTSAMLIANSFCPPHLRTRSQLFYNGTFVALGNVLSGLIFKMFFSKDHEDVEKSYMEFQTAFKWNGYLTAAGIVFFIYLYGIRENLLFNRENADRKIREIERQFKEGSDSEEACAAPASDIRERIKVKAKRQRV